MLTSNLSKAKLNLNRLVLLGSSCALKAKVNYSSMTNASIVHLNLHLRRRRCILRIGAWTCGSSLLGFGKVVGVAGCLGIGGIGG